MKAKLLNQKVYTVYSELLNKDLHRIVSAKTILEVTNFTDYDTCEGYFFDNRTKEQKEIVLDLNDITFDDMTDLDLSFWNLNKDFYLNWLDVFQDDFPNLNITKLRKLVTIGLNEDFHKLPTGLKELIQKYQAYLQIIKK